MKTSVALLFFLFVYLRLPFKHGNADNVIERKTYIVYMGDVSNTMSTPEAHRDLLTTVIGEKSLAKESLVRSYTKSFNGFAAKLLPEEAKRLSENYIGVVSVFLSQRRPLLTTRSWDFLGFPETVQRKLSTESNVTIGMLDSGISADSASFSDEGMLPIPSRWKGQCVTGPNFTGCNNKIIGAKFYHAESDPLQGDVASPADALGHGTHTASTAAGVSVKGASLYGLAEGTARGAVPSARLAVYKVCWVVGCYDADILAAFDDAIHDGVDIISLSLGSFFPQDYFEDSIAIGSFHAMRRGILISCAAGNFGDFGSVVNVAPWILTVAANTMNRQFQTRLKLGNGREQITHWTINTDSSGTQSLIKASDAATESAISEGTQESCGFGTLDENKVKGKIVYCKTPIHDPTEPIKAYGASGAIWSPDNFKYTDSAFSHSATAAAVTPAVGVVVETYLNSSGTHEAEICKSETVTASAPTVATFSSRGPNYISSKILKPDISAPGVDILAAYSGMATLSESKYDDRFVKYNVLSGTSMACPHVTGAAAYVKSFHFDWSPAAIKSALMTTAMEMKDESYSTSTYGREFGYGAGQIDPVKALDPGLVYDTDELSYIRFLCDEGYSTEQLQKVTDKKINCSLLGKTQGSDGINYPTMQHFVADGGDDRSPIVFYRTVTNVGPSNSVYKATVASRDGLNITVDPDVLTFTDSRQKKSFKVVVEAPDGRNRDVMWTGSLVWSDSIHKVRSPIVVYADMPANGR